MTTQLKRIDMDSLVLPESFDKVRLKLLDEISATEVKLQKLRKEYTQVHQVMKDVMTLSVGDPVVYKIVPKDDPNTNLCLYYKTAAEAENHRRVFANGDFIVRSFPAEELTADDWKGVWPSP
jgi:hypothetical protein